MNSCKKKLNYTFKKKERIVQRKVIIDLFKKGKKYKVFPLLAFINRRPSGIGCNQVLFQIPKKMVGKAYMRNRLRRQLREIYRLQKNNFLQRLTYPLYMAFIYIGHLTLPSYRLLERVFLKLLHQFCQDN